MIKKIVNFILKPPFIWRLFRKTLDFFFGLYKKRFAVLKEFGITEQTSVIDIACGTGEYSAITNSQYLGVDMDKQYIDRAQKLYGIKNKKFLCDDANTATIQDASYEAAILIDATHHLTDDENRALFKTLNRVAAKTIAICDPITQEKRNLIGRFLISIDRGNYIRPKKKLLNLIQETLVIEKVKDMKMLSVTSVCILARPKRNL
ncbi:MAG: hypothetical protein A3I24_02725 [Candidatus Harrisonbacteria bacterium RIFCSPLOWO2_02_FULL_41_13b]|uniref:Methyltransferase domain-containing protein n=1 Tax=Candidatus Harrisonbacteria bacterium RIFCSPLOWO2_02_FULL_41_13b TaxID=1798409 RepID=A0A1G1ZTI8_9BACT|nr:MAG: hypothetical protein A3J53_02145 [Candidatus Harrisonbacteria bacterium RIFCSPHIGHO2_02_FULL_40_20]OGY67070.1 MAG: hypothetical protein A3I24_02725 [Candidatus Harrisonbacteria bacterium RIFCSPLOWO2_02_FULL_41_13b]